jgi:pseudaminic acid cytidylyltransferase
MANSIAIIPARGGSKRIPRKNIKNFLGKPIIAYSIEAALKSKLFDEVMVSTDDNEIAEISKSLGASVPFFRSESNSNDHAGTVDVLVEVLKQYESLGHIFDYACCIYPTAPFITPQILETGFYTVQDYDTIFPIVRFSYPIQRALQKSHGKTAMIWPENIAKRSQDLPEAFHDAGQWYWFNVHNFISCKKLWTDNSHGIEISELEAQDIDNESDWQIAEMKYELLKKRVLIDNHF